MIKNYQLIRSKRKTLSLQINSDAQIIVRAPNRLSIMHIEQFIDKKSNWIEQKITDTLAKQLKKPTYLTGEKFLYLGNEYPLSINAKHPKELTFDAQTFKLSKGGQAEFLAWYKESFKKIALPRLEYYAKNYHFTYHQVRLKTQKTRWGSCSSINNINLNYLLIQAPMSVIDYVLVHELCHTVHKNHSSDFWQLVCTILPHYKASQRWLKEHGHRLTRL